MPLDMPESVLVRFKGQMQPGITLRDLVHAIPYYAIKRGLLTVEKKGKKNIFSGRILEIEGLGHLKCEQVGRVRARRAAATPLAPAKGSRAGRRMTVRVRACVRDAGV